MPSSIAERTKTLYNEIAPEYNNAFPVIHHLEHLLLLADKLKSGGRILDAGCAGGMRTNFFKSLGFDITGVDFAVGQIVDAQTRYKNISFIEADILALPEIFSPGEFDGIFCYATLDHLARKNIPTAIKNFNYILKSGGALLVATRKGKGVMHTQDKYSVGKRRRFTLMMPDELKLLLEKKGFSISRFEIFSSSTRENMEFNLALCEKVKEVAKIK